MENGQIVRGVFEELFGRGKLDYVDRNFDRNYRGHDTLSGDFGPDQLKAQVQMYRTAFPDLSVRIDDLVETSEKVLVRWTARGTHRGEFLGKAATNKRAEIQGITVATCRNGKIVEDFTQWDAFGLLRDLGIAPQLSQLNIPQQPGA
jgi:steroid delta-isomerase-like uncharacterized protein